MNKEKNIQQEANAERKKEKTSVLEKIRRRTGLLVGIVGLALVIFILESLLGSGASIFGNDELSTVGTINGKKIDRNDFVNRVEGTLNNYRQRNQGQEVDEGVRASVIDNVWQQYVSELVIKPQFDKIGITVGEDEVYERVVANPVQAVMQQLTDPNTGRVNDQIARPDGSLDVMKWKQVIQNMPADQDMAIRQIEDNVKSTRYFEKFRMLVNKGLYVTAAEAKAASFEGHSNAVVSYVAKRYDALSDSTIKLSDSDLQKYYNDNSWKFSSTETTRKIEYVAFNVLPSEKDLADIEKDAQRVASEFKGRTRGEDSSFIQQESENGTITIQDFTKKTMIVRDSTIFTAAPGTVYGPYNEGAYVKIYKLEAVNSIADSGRVRHILIGTKDPKTSQPKRSMTQAKREADSLLTLIKSKSVSFDTLVKTVSDDMGSIDKGGDYGWINEATRFVAPFKNAALMGVKGNISVVETEFGYHIIEVLDVSKERHQSYSVAQIFKLIAPSDETNQKIFAEANEFGGVNNTAELFDKAVESKKLTKRMADNIKEGDRQLPGLSQAKELVRWVYSAKKGDIATFSMPDKHIVAKVTGIRTKGVLPFEEVKEEVTAKAIQSKKAEMFINDFNTKAASAKTTEEVAAKTGLQVMKSEALAFTGNNVEGLGFDPIFVGTALGTKAGAMSKPTAGTVGVFVVSVNKVTTEPETADGLALKKRELEQGLTSRSDFEIVNALKDISDIEDHKSRID